MSESSGSASLVDEAARRRFEAAWRAGTPEPIEQFLPPPDDPRHLPTLEELILIELEMAWKSRPNGQAEATLTVPPRVESYLSRFPSLRAPEVLLRLVEQEFRVRQRHGDRPSFAEYRGRFPDLVKEDQQLIATNPEARADQTTVGREGRAPAPEAWTPGTQLGRYKLSVVHARGGMGLVWRAADESLGRTVALKQLNDRLSGEPAARDRFLAEARIAAQLEHPGVVPVYDLSSLDGDQPYYTMKLVHGRTLTEEIRKFHALPPRSGGRPVEQMRLLTALLAVTRALAYAHSRGVVHRDLKPDNIILGDYGETIVLDWGLAKLVRKGQAAEPSAPVVSLPEDLEATRQGTVIGTPVYMSPEQAAGKIDEVDQQTDVYGLGAILYQILTGRPPFEARTFSELQQLILTAEPTPPRSIQPHLGRPLEAICLKAMVKKKAQRYSSAADLAADLERHLADQPVAAYREPWTARLGRWSRRHRTLVASGVVASLLLIAGGVGGAVLLDRAEQQRLREVDRAEQQRLREAYEQLARLRSSGEADSSLALAEVQAGRFASAEKILHQAVQRVQGQAELEELRGRLARQHARARGVAEFYRLLDEAWVHSFQEFDDKAIAGCEKGLRSLGIFEKQEWWKELPLDDLTDPQKEKLRQDAYQMFHLLAALHVKVGLLQFGTAEATGHYRKALVVIDRLQPFQRSQSLRVVEICACTLLGQNDKLPAAAADEAEPTHSTDEFFLGLMHFWVKAMSENFLTKMLAEGMAGRSKLMDFKDPLARSQQLLRSAITRDPSQYVYHIWLGVVLLADKDFHGAELAFGSAVALRPNDHFPHSFRAMALFFHVRNVQDPAVRNELCRRGLRYVDRAIELGPNEPSHRYMRGDFLAWLERRDEALEAVARYIESERPLSSWKDWPKVPGLFGVASAIATQRQYLQNVLGYAAKTTQGDSRDVLAMSAQALALLGLDKPDEAFTAAERALALRPDDPRGRAVRGAVHLKRGQHEEALADFAVTFKTEPRHFQASLGRALALEKKQDWDAARAAFERVLEVSGTDWQRIEGHLGKARVCARLGKTEDSRKALDQAREINAKLAERQEKE